jgi:hypothetical protein
LGCWPPPQTHDAPKAPLACLWPSPPFSAALLSALEAGRRRLLAGQWPPWSAGLLRPALPMRTAALTLPRPPPPQYARTQPGHPRRRPAPPAQKQTGPPPPDCFLRQDPSCKAHCNANIRAFALAPSQLRLPLPSTATHCPSPPACAVAQQSALPRHGRHVRPPASGLPRRPAPLEPLPARLCHRHWGALQAWCLQRVSGPE